MTVRECNDRGRGERAIGAEARWNIGQGAHDHFCTLLSLALWGEAISCPRGALAVSPECLDVSP